MVLLSSGHCLGERLSVTSPNFWKRPAILGFRRKFVKMKEFAYVQPNLTSVQVTLRVKLDSIRPGARQRAQRPICWPADHWGQLRQITLCRVICHSLECPRGACFVATSFVS